MDTAVLDQEEDRTTTDMVVAADGNIDTPTGLTARDTPNAPHVIGNYRVHEAAEVIPTLVGEAFEKLVEEIAQNGQWEAVVIHGDVLIEGVDTVRAIGVLKDRGIDIDLQAVPWQPRPEQTVPEFLAYKHLRGPRFTKAQRAQIAADLLPLIEKERTAAQESARIKPGQVLNPRGINKRTADKEGGNETCPTTDAKARNKSKIDRSTVGRIAAMASVTNYAAAQAVKIKRQAPNEVIEAVKAGVMKPKTVIAGFDEPTDKGKPDQTKAGTKIDHPFTPTTPLEHDLVAGWARLRDTKVAVSERADARDVMRAILKAEEAAEQRASKPTEGGGQ